MILRKFILERKQMNKIYIVKRPQGEYEDYHELLGVIRGYKLSVDQIDNQIKSLKGENKNERNIIS